MIRLMDLRNGIIRLAHANPKLRKDLLPLITREQGVRFRSRNASSEGEAQHFDLGGLNWKVWTFDGYTLDQAKRDVKRILTVVLAAKGDPALRGFIDKTAVYSLAFNGLDADNTSFVISPVFWFFHVRPYSEWLEAGVDGCWSWDLYASRIKF